MKDTFLDLLRDRNLPIETFRKYAANISKSIASKISLSISPNEKVVLIVILRAGLALLPAFQEKFPTASIGLIGIERDEKDATSRLYYKKIPHLSLEERILVLDPMLATGSSAHLALNVLKLHGAKNLSLISVIAAPEGIKLIRKHHPEVSQYSVALDEGLDARKFITPGLGDFGDRYFGTVE